jgi:mRNA interferase MazF
MQVTTKLRRDNLSLPLNENNFTGTPLLKQSELRLHKIFILNDSLIAGNITNVSSDFMRIVISKLIKLIQ